MGTSSSRLSRIARSCRRCLSVQVVAGNKLTSDGTLAHSDFSKFQAGKQFVVDKRSGQISGDITNAYGEPQVLDSGSKQQAYKVLTVYRPKVYVGYLYVQ